MLWSGHGAGQGTEVRVGLRRGWFRYVNFALGSVGTAAIVFEALRLLESDPNQAFALLRAWGPNFFIGLVIVLIVGSLLNQLMEISRDGVQAQRQMAEAMTSIAQKDDRQLQELQTLAAYTAQQSERMHRRHAHTEQMLRLIALRLKISPEDIALGERDV